jgi:DNA-binding transcriptional LysR family regulator
MLGLRLFHRHHDGLRPTEEAMALLPFLDGVASSLEALGENAAALREGRAGYVRIAAIPSLANAVMPRVIGSATVRGLGLRIGVQVAVTRDVVNWVARGAVDFGLAHDIMEDPLIATEDLGAAGMACVVPAEHPFARRRIVEPAALRGMDYVSYASRSPLSDRIAAAFHQVGEAFAPTIDVGASTAICAVVDRTGMPGIVEDYILSLGWWPKLQAVPLAPPVPLRPRLLTARDRQPTLAAREVLEECRRVVMEVLRDRMLPLRPRRPTADQTVAAPLAVPPISADGDGG